MIFITAQKMSTTQSTLQYSQSSNSKIFNVVHTQFLNVPQIDLNKCQNTTVETSNIKTYRKIISGFNVKYKCPMCGIEFYKHKRFGTFSLDDLNILYKCEHSKLHASDPAVVIYPIAYSFLCCIWKINEKDAPWHAIIGNGKREYYSETSMEQEQIANYKSPSILVYKLDDIEKYIKDDDICFMNGNEMSREELLHHIPNKDATMSFPEVLQNPSP